MPGVGQTDNGSARNIHVVERFLAAFTGRWPTEAELDELLAPDVVFVERPNLLSPAGSERDAAATRAGIAKGRQVLARQAYEVRDHVASGDTVVTRMRWSGELAAEVGEWPAGTRLTAWCVGHYRLAAGRIARIEQHDCYEAPVPPPPTGA
jgi:ketosteroid isomerase-like protein